ncbi:MAG: heme exporter protein CcmB [Deltaproteobacteria bacterium]|nr:heme exporter protein CcmB [Deltaproteobacteria bacterium]
MNLIKINAGFGAIFKREIISYFTSPIAYIFIVIFLLLSGFFTFYISGFFEAGSADLRIFFQWQPWIYIFLIPAISMKLWADEKRIGTIELLLTFPISLPSAVYAKFFAAWLFIGISLFFTFPMVITVIYLGSPDIGAIICGYLGCLLIAGAFIGIGAMTSSITDSQAISFIISAVISMFFILAGYPPVTAAISGWTPLWFCKIIEEFGFLSHFNSISRGVIDIRDIIYYFSVIFFMLSLNCIILYKRRV